MGFRTNGKDLQWLGCCWCPNQPGAVNRTRDPERDGLLALAAAKKENWRIKMVDGQWLGLCRECQERGCDFPKQPLKE